MKITLLDIKGFGKFNNTRIEPGPGFNLIYENNEAGKSTLQAFIRAMLYGLKGGRRAKDGSLPPLKHYKPWNAQQYSGILEYTLDDGSSYRVGRNFDKGTVNIYDDKANNLTSDFPHLKDTGPKFAEEHLGLDEAAFERSVFIKQLQCAVDEEGRKALVEKLSNLNASGSEDLSLANAIKALETALLERVGTGRTTTRPLDKVNMRLKELQEEKQRLTDLNDRYLDTALELHEKKNLLNELEESLKIKKSLKENIRFSRLRALKNELSDILKKADENSRSIDKCNESMANLKNFENIDEDSVHRAMLLLYDESKTKAEIEEEKANLDSLTAAAESIKEGLDSEEAFIKRTEPIERILNANNQKQAENEKKSAANKNRSLVITLLSGIAAPIFILAYVFTYSVPYLIFGAVFGIIAAISLIKPSKKALASDEGLLGSRALSMALSESGFSDLSQYLEYREAQLKGRNLLEHKNNKISETQKRIVEFQAEIESINARLDEIISLAKMDSTDKAQAVTSIKEGVERLNKAKEELKVLISEKSAIEERIKSILREAESLSEKPVSSPEELDSILDGIESLDLKLYEEISEWQINNEIVSLESRINQVKLDIASLKARLEQVPTEGELTRVMEEIGILQEEKKSLELIGSGLTLAIQVLNEASLTLQRDYIPALNEEMSRIMDYLTLGRYRKVLTNDALQINLESPETDELVSVNSLSGGAMDQVYLSMRLATVKLLERNGETLPLFLDEPFAQFDETRVKKAFELLKEMSEERQIFLFTCREREFELARSVFGNNLNRIRL